MQAQTIAASACCPASPQVKASLSHVGTGMVMNTQDASDYSQRHPKGLRATYWLFKTDQEDAWYAAASLVGSIATLGEQYIDAMGATKLVKPLFISLRAKDVACRAAALRALHKLCIDSACRAIIARVRCLLYPPAVLEQSLYYKICNAWLCITALQGCCCCCCCWALVAKYLNCPLLHGAAPDKLLAWG